MLLLLLLMCSFLYCLIQGSLHFPCALVKLCGQELLLLLLLGYFTSCKLSRYVTTTTTTTTTTTNVFILALLNRG